MRLLIDTHALLWFVGKDPQLSARAEAAIDDLHNQQIVSIVSLWEIAIKHSLGRLPLILPLADFITRHVTLSKVQLLPITVAHILKVAELPHHHRDPFDRLLIAQALVENIPIVSVDDKFDPYGITRIW
jgi:PIN domain nuclease of toxin-antitoxin system